MKNKILKTMLPLATIASVAAPVACLTSCGKVQIVGPTINDYYGTTEYVNGQFVSKCIIQNFILKDKTYSIADLNVHASLVGEEGKPITWAVKRTLSPTPNTFLIELSDFGEFPSSLTTYQVKLDIYVHGKKKKKEILYTNIFNITFDTQVIVPRSGSGTSIGPNETEFTLPGFFINIEDKTNVKCELKPCMADLWPETQSVELVELHEDFATNDVNQQYGFNVKFSSAPVWTAFNTYTFNIKISNGDDVLFENDEVIYSVFRSPSTNL